jgi:hypothetical protein
MYGYLYVKTLLPGLYHKHLFVFTSLRAGCTQPRISSPRLVHRFRLASAAFI